MKISELNAEDKALLETKFPEELEKEAEQNVGQAGELYSVGFEKLASNAAEALDKMAEEEEKEEKEEKKEKEEPKLDEEHKKEAAVRGAFIARGYIDGLMKLGEDRFEDPLYYLYPAILEKIGASRSGGRQVGSVEGKLREELGQLKARSKAESQRYKNMAKAAPGKVSAAIKSAPSKVKSGGKSALSLARRHPIGLAALLAGAGYGGYQVAK